MSQSSRGAGPWYVQPHIYNDDASEDTTFTDSIIDMVVTVNSIGDGVDSDPGNGDCDDGTENCTLYVDSPIIELLGTDNFHGLVVVAEVTHFPGCGRHHLVGAKQIDRPK